MQNDVAPHGERELLSFPYDDNK